MKVCPGCGRTEKEVPFIGFLCRDCYLKTHEVVHIPELRLKRCPTCGRAYLGKWVNFSLESVRTWVRKHIKTDMDNAFVSVGFSSVRDDEIVVTVLVSGDIEGVPVQITRSVPIPVVYEQCPDCSRRAGGYYEAVVQIRGDEQRVNEAMRLLRRWVERADGKGAYISREIRRDGGVDVYIGSRKLAEKLASRLAKTLGGSIKRSYTLVTERNGEGVYRVTLAVRV